MSLASRALSMRSACDLTASRAGDARESGAGPRATSGVRGSRVHRGYPARGRRRNRHHERALAAFRGHLVRHATRKARVQRRDVVHEIFDGPHRAHRSQAAHRASSCPACSLAGSQESYAAHVGSRPRARRSKRGCYLRHDVAAFRRVTRRAVELAEKQGTSRRVRRSDLAMEAVKAAKRAVSFARQRGPTSEGQRDREQTTEASAQGCAVITAFAAAANRDTAQRRLARVGALAIRQDFQHDE